VFVALRAEAGSAGMQQIDRATVTLWPQGAPAQPPVERALPHRWDIDHPHEDGRARYRLTLPPVSSEEPYALFFPRIGNQAEVRVGGQLVARVGELGDESTDSTKLPVLLVVPAALLSHDTTTELQVDAAMQSGRWGGLSAVIFGPQSAVEPAYRTNELWRRTGPAAIAWALVLMGVVAGGLWWQHGESLYGLFALISFFGVVTVSGRLLTAPPVPWPAWGAVCGVALCLLLLLMARFVLVAIAVLHPWMRTAFWVYFAVCTCAVTASFVLRQPLIYTLVLGSLQLPAMVMVYHIARRMWRAPTWESTWMCLAGFAVILAGARDFVVVRLPESGSMSFSVLPLAVFFLVLAMGCMVAGRYSHQVMAYRELNASLAQRIAEREAELGASYRLQQRQSEEQATLQERQRIMRDIHDGVGAHLVGLLSMVKKGGAPSEALQEQAHAALDELRMAVDSLQPVNGDLATVLATLRYRLQPRLEAAGVQVEWEVAALPEMRSLTPTTVLNVQRILLEAFTNVLKHARATTVRVTARRVDAPDRLELEVQDDGAGIPEARGQVSGHGLGNMRARAQSIGATLAIERAEPRGTSVKLALILN
jgi:signal transduction histidine kinase